MSIRHALPTDVDTLAEIEAASYPPAEGASRQSIAGRKGIVLTCKERLIGFYAQFGFVDEGVSVSTHGDVVWHQMRLTF